MHALIFLAFALGVMLSPDTLVLLGNTLGHEGRAALSGFLVAAGLHVLTAQTYGRLGLHPAMSEGESRVLQAAFGPLVATVLPLCARVVYTVAATTGILAVAGYVFNEVFVYWFPNLGLSFCLLGMVVGLTLAGPRMATLAQLSYVALALGGVLCLVAIGLLGVGQTPAVFEVTSSSSVVTVQGLLAGRALYQQYCGTCHGPQGKGDGPAASAMNPKPRDHTDGHYMNALSEAHLTTVISEGGAAVQRSPLMPSWKGALTPPQVQDVIAYLRTLAVPPYKP